MTERLPRCWGRNLAIGIIVLLLIAISLFSFQRWGFNRPPVDLGLLDELWPGMSKSEVEKILGPVETVQYKQKAWAYSREGSWPILYIYFDDAGKFIEAEYDY